MRLSVLLIFGITGLNLCLLAQETSWERHVNNGLTLRAQGQFKAAENEYLAAIEEGVPASVITASLYERFESRGLGDFTDKVLSAMRYEFGGHKEKKA